MRSIRIEWGKFKLELPGNIFVSLLLKLASLLFHYMEL